MRLSGIEIVVGEPSEKLPTRRRLNYIVSFKNDAGGECQQRHETLVHEQALHDTPGIARIVAQVVHGLMIEAAAAGREPDQARRTSRSGLQERCGQRVRRWS